MKRVFEHQRIRETFYVTLGSLIIALSINTIMLPNKIVAGGANGVSIVLSYLFGWQPALILYLINIPLLGLCFLLLGKEVGFKTMYGSMIYPFFVAITSFLPPLTTDLFLATIYGGIVTGIGLGLVFKANASTGGTAIISQVVHKYLHISLGVAILFVDGLVILSALIAFNVNLVLFSLICLFLIGRTVDIVQVGMVRSKNVMIISDKYIEIKATLTQELDKGVTLIPIENGYREKSSKLIMTVIREKDFTRVKETISEIDDTAFVVALNASEVHGRGFSLKRVADSYAVDE